MHRLSRSCWSLLAGPLRVRVVAQFSTRVAWVINSACIRWNVPIVYRSQRMVMVVQICSESLPCNFPMCFLFLPGKGRHHLTFCPYNIVQQDNHDSGMPLAAVSSAGLSYRHVWWTDIEVQLVTITRDWEVNTTSFLTWYVWFVSCATRPL